MSMMRIKLVPDDAPNADGSWIDVDPASLKPDQAHVLATAGTAFRDMARALKYAGLVPEGLHVVAVETLL
jgi:hypothetical protein